MRMIDMSERDRYDLVEAKVYVYKCPRCQNTLIMRKFKYCPMCGCEISWV